MNERVTEDFVRDHFKNDPLFDAIKFDEQKTNVKEAKRILSTASKKLTGKQGYPEFIITFPSLPDSIIVIECKADRKFHESKDKSKPIEYAVDGVLHYAKALSQEYNVIAIAVSGDNKNSLSISSFYFEKGNKKYVMKDKKILDIYSYIQLLENESIAKKIEMEKITRTAIDLNEEFQSYSIPEYERITIVSGILLALQNKAFCDSYKSSAYTKTQGKNGEKEMEPTPRRLSKAIVEAIDNELIDKQIDKGRVDVMKREYGKIEGQTIATVKEIKRKKSKKPEKNYVLRDIIIELEKNILPLVSQGDKGYDILGKFYTEFIRYAGTDQKTGLVLTPEHVTELFCDLVQLEVNDVVVDTCCGTGGFLVAAMKYMLGKAGNDDKIKKGIKKKQLIGIETRPDMFTFACSNMIMSGDGKAHVYKGDSFLNEMKNKISPLKPTVAFLNPPYDVGIDGQLEFIKNALTYVEPGGRCAAICQMSVAVHSGKDTISAKEDLLEKHTLRAVISMPDDLFHPVGVVTCILVFDAHRPHSEKKETFFGYLKDDGHKIKRNKGRVDQGEWEYKKSKFLDLYINRRSQPGLSVSKVVTAKDEWSAEAYMDTDYSNLSDFDFIRSIKELAAFRFLHEDVTELHELEKFPSILSKPKHKAQNIELNTHEWREFKISDIFNVRGAKKSFTQDQIAPGEYIYVTTKNSNNGVLSTSDIYTEEGNVITFDSATNGKAFYQRDKFASSDHVEILEPIEFQMSKELGIFIVTVLNLQTYRYNYGRKRSQTRIKQENFLLPATKDNKPDWEYMENYIKSLPYSKSL